MGGWSGEAVLGCSFACVCVCGCGVTGLWWGVQGRVVCVPFPPHVRRWGADPERVRRRARRGILHVPRRHQPPVHPTDHEVRPCAWAGAAVLSRGLWRRGHTARALPFGAAGRSTWLVFSPPSPLAPLPAWCRETEYDAVLGCRDSHVRVVSGPIQSMDLTVDSSVVRIQGSGGGRVHGVMHVWSGCTV